MTDPHARSSADTLSLTFQERFSRRFSSRSTAMRMNSATGSFSSKTASMRSLVPEGKRAGICSPLICVLPMPVTIDDITYCYKSKNKRYHLLPSHELMISSISSTGESDMAFQIYHINTPHYSVSEVSGDVLDAMREALRLENESGVEGWMIRDFRGPTIREYPAFLCKRPS